MINKTTFLFLLLLFCACQANEEATDALESEIFELKSNEAKQAYLEELFKEDQRYRQGQSAQIIQTYGKQSDQFQRFIKMSDTTDSLNLVKVEKFINRHGYPNPAKVGDLAAPAPWAIIHHAPDYDARFRHFKTLQKAYQKEYIDGGAFSLYLERMYNYKFRQRFVIEGVYDEQVQIDSLIHLLELM